MPTSIFNTVEVGGDLIVETQVRVLARNAARREFHVKFQVDGVDSDYDFTGATELRFIAKKGANALDGAALFTYLSTGAEPRVAVVDPAIGGRFAVEFQAEDLLKGGVFHYRLDVTKPNEDVTKPNVTQTVMFGPLIIVGV